MSATTTHITVRVPLKIRRPPGRKTVVTPVATSGATTQPTRADQRDVPGAAICMRVEGLAGIVRDLVAISPEAVGAAA